MKNTSQKAAEQVYFRCITQTSRLLEAATKTALRSVLDEIACELTRRDGYPEVKSIMDDDRAWNQMLNSAAKQVEATGLWRKPWGSR